MTREVLRIPRGEWLLQTAAGSALGRMVIRLAHHDGFRTINVVRRQDTARELEALGADAVINTADEPLEERVRALTSGAGVRYAIDAVGGETGSQVIHCLAPGGRMLVYGTLAAQPLSIDPRLLMVGAKRIEGFWLSEWVRNKNPIAMLLLFRKISGLIQAGILTSNIGDSFPLPEVAGAVKVAEQPGRKGKVLLRMT
jgi:NADPH:quinone reductase-like Zn-dependent oxidoreductase